MIGDFLHQNQAVISLLILAAVFIGFVLERFPPAVIAAAGAGLFLALGFLAPDDALNSFSNNAPVTIGAMFVLSGALVRTGALEAVATRVLNLADTRPRAALAGLLAGAFFASAFMNNTPVVLVLIPIMTQLAGALNVSAQRLLIPLSFAAILGGTCTLIGTSTNLLVAGVAYELGEPSFGIFEITGVGLIVGLVGAAVMLVLGPILLPHERTAAAAGDADEEPLFLTSLRVREDAAVIGTTLDDAKPFAPRGVKVIGLRRGGVNVTAAQESVTLKEKDRVIVRARLTEMLTLADSKDFDIGLTKRAAPSDADAEIIEISIGPNHVGIGRRVDDLPFLSRYPIAILGVSRYRHHAGPDLESTRLKPGDRLLLKGSQSDLESLRANTSLIFAGPPAARAYRRGRIAVAVAALAGVVALSAFGILPIEAAAIIAVAGILILRCVDAEEAWSFIDGNVLVLIIAMLMIGTGLQETGAVDIIVRSLGPVLTYASPLLLIFMVYAITSVMTELITNNAVAVLMTPLVISIAVGLGVEPRPYVVAVMFGASASFATPIGYQTNTLVYAAGNYHFSDFLKIGLPMNVIVGVTSCLAIYFMFSSGAP